MFCGKSKTQEDIENEKISKDIEAKLKEDRKNKSSQIKLLLLGRVPFYPPFVSSLTVLYFHPLVIPST